MALSYPPTPPMNGANFTESLHDDTYPAIDSTKSNHKGRSIFITGGSRGIGRATALSFAKAGAACIAVGDIASFENLETELQDAARSAGHASPPKVLLLHLDVCDSSSIQAAAQAVAETFGKLDVLVNNAGFMTNALPIVDSVESEYWRTFEVNLRGVYLVTKAFLPVLLDVEGGLKTVLNVNSVAAHNLRPEASAYGTSKLAVLRLTEFLMVEGAPKGLLAYSVHPGAIMTKLAEAMPQNTFADLTHKSEMAADTIVFLTQEKRDWLAGRYVSCTWDMPQFLARKEEIISGDKLKVRLVL
ncbi:hypothetical protein BP6252_13848 [Coleophoma cylindrospora]|uniref:Uncharacterized protein n=1 Tax=Coleophoma cylindrospora TaxID=1849047 RepID=A0A3D8Q5L3_9HELO|nr:hypothetical protein BP6252_13848 [Coleophoma cylindrospora]